jgi:hypothetical protein
MLPREVLDSFEYGLERVYRELVAYEMLVGSTITQEQIEAIDLVRLAMHIVRGLAERALCIGVHSSAILQGRPRFVITREQLETLIEANFTGPQIAHMLGVSLSTVRRRMDLYNLSIRATYAAISDQELDARVLEISRMFPMCGSKQMAGHLLARGLRVQQSRIRVAQRRVDPDGVVMRRLTVTQRRRYNVAAPLSLYHIDGNHKLIRYDHRMIIESSRHENLSVIVYGMILLH